MTQLVTLAKQQFLPHKTDFTVSQIPDLTGRVVIVTGGNTGIGKETVKALLDHNAKVYMASRSKARAEEAIQELKEQTGKEALLLELDLSSLESVRQAAQTFLSKESELHILYNNAGVMLPPADKVTVEGYDLQYGTNVLGHFLFQELLLPALAAGVSSSPDKHTRIVTTSSGAAHLFAVDFDTLKDGVKRRKLSSVHLYAQSKFLNAVVAREAAQRYADKGILSLSVDPGSIRTELYRYQPRVLQCLTSPFLFSPAQGALSQLWAGTMPGAVEHNGEYIIPWVHAGRCREEAYDLTLGERVWNTLLEQTKDFRA
ncbi:NAD-P-binding protein [Cristinia sonorae]|uniref:NAD-P-binding protein n=1 Tax=Cristinia sonorae TaxID=1940300 RepID=A0A8K0US13_9AGAR|nr:NAD-P-binding protein [Cristinia sonorae]